jgi:xylulose-5-phosphate/fructose-6-phosphate phosphoketolase
LSDENPDIVVATAGDYAVEETTAGIKMLKEKLPKVKIKFINFFKLDILAGKDQLTQKEILEKFLSPDLPIIFNYHGYRGTIQKLLFDYNLSERIIINGYEENGSTTSPFDMRARNGLSRMHFLKDVTSQLEKFGKLDLEIKNKIHQEMDDMLE